MDFGESSRESEFVILKERKLVSISPVYMGMQRLSFLLEACAPGTVPDAQLLASSLDLVTSSNIFKYFTSNNYFHICKPHSAVVARAALLLECSYFVHCCNKGQWPTWMKLSFPMFRPSGPLPVRPGANSATRRSHVMQRTAGKMFYQWAEVIFNIKCLNSNSIIAF